MTRLFVGVALASSPSLEQARAAASQLRNARVARDWHVTLRFLGEADPQQVAQSLGRIRHAPFSVAVGGLGAFPTMQRARVLWVGVVSSELASLQKQVVRATGHFGQPEPRRPFVAHATIARFDPPVDARPARLAYREAPVDQQRIDQIHLFQSSLSTSGAVHEVVQSFPLRSPTPTTP